MNQLYYGNEAKLFPTKTSFFVFWSYISLFVSQGLLITAVHKSQIYGFNPIFVVLLTEVVKLLICIIVYLSRSQSNISGLINDIKKNNRLLLLYLIPSFLYCVYNNLTFINLKLFDLTTYYCLMQFRIVLTAVIYQVLFRRQLTLTQWTSLILLTSGCLLKEYGLYSSMSVRDNSQVTNATNHSISNATDATPNEKTKDFEKDKTGLKPLSNFMWLTSLLMIQMFCSCFAGVYNEYLLKDSSTAKSADVILQNIFMYADSIICNLFVYLLIPNHDKVQDKISVETILHILLTSPLVIVLIFNNALSGLVASFFLKSLNSILKTFASALELFAVAFLAWILFDDKIDMHTIAALSLVSVAMIVYTKNPVSVAPPVETVDSKDGFMLIPTTGD